MEQTQYLGYFTADPQLSAAFAEAITMCALDFIFDDEKSPDYDMLLSDEFRECFPPTRPGRSLSGLWDVIDPAGIGVDNKEYLEPFAIAKRTSFGVVFHSSGGEFNHIIQIIEHLKTAGGSARIWWSALNQHDETAPSGTVIIDNHGTYTHLVQNDRRAVAEQNPGTDDMVARLASDRRQLLDLVEHLVPTPHGASENSHNWIGVLR